MGTKAKLAAVAVVIVTVGGVTWNALSESGAAINPPPGPEQAPGDLMAVAGPGLQVERRSSDLLVTSREPATSTGTAHASAEQDEEPEWAACVRLLGNGALEDDAQNYFQAKACLEALAPILVDGQELGEWLADERIPAAHVGLLAHFVMREWAAEDVLNELVACQRATPDWHNEWVGLEHGLRQVLIEDQQYQETLAASLAIDDLFDETGGSGPLRVVGAALSSHPLMLEMLRFGGLGQFGGTNEQVDVAATYYSVGLRGSQRLDYVRELLSAGGSDPNHGLGCTLANLLLRKESREGGQDAACLVLLRDVLDHPRFQRGAAKQLLAQERRGEVGDDEWQWLLGKARDVARR